MNLKLFYNVLSIICSLVGFGFFVHGMLEGSIGVMMTGMGGLMIAALLERLGEPENDKS